MGKGRKKAPSAGTSPKDAAYYEDLDNSVGFVTRMAYRAFARALEAQLHPHVSISQWRFLRALWIEDGITQVELSQRVGLREARTVHAVKTLERDALITRTPCEQDRRRIIVRLTPKARRMKTALMPRLAEVNALATVGISESDLAVMRRTLVRIRTNLRAHRGAGTGDIFA